MKYFSQDHYILFYTLKPWLADVFPGRQPRRGHHGRGWPSPPRRRTGRGTSDRGQAAATSSPAPYRRHAPPRSPHSGAGSALKATEPWLGRNGDLSRTALLVRGTQSFLLRPPELLSVPAAPSQPHPDPTLQTPLRGRQEFWSHTRTDQGLQPGCPQQSRGLDELGRLQHFNPPPACKMESVGVPTSSGCREDWGSLSV